MTEWFYRDPQWHKVGPLTDAEFAVCVSLGEVRPATPVWRSGLTDWTTYAALLAREDGPMRQSSSRVSARAPVNSSYRTMISLGLSRTHQTPALARVTSSRCMPYGMLEVEEEEEDCLPLNPPVARGSCDPVWLGRLFIRLALASAAVLVAHSFLAHLGAAHAHPAPPVLKPVLAVGAGSSFRLHPGSAAELESPR